MHTVEQKKAQRDLYLKQLYELSEGDVWRAVSYFAMSRALGWNDKTSDEVTAYLKNEGLIDFPAVGKVHLTHKGVKYVEKTLSRKPRAERRSPHGFITLSAEGDINIGGDLVGHDKKTKKKSS